MAVSLVDSFAADFKPEDFTDEYQEQLRTLIEAKLEQGETLDTEATFGEEGEEEGGKVLDLMEALRRQPALADHLPQHPVTRPDRRRRDRLLATDGEQDAGRIARRRRYRTGAQRGPGAGPRPAGRWRPGDRMISADRR